MKPTRSDVEAVIREYRNIGPMAFGSLYRYRDSTKYDLLDEDDQTYPPKAIYNVALKRALGESDKTGNDSGLPGGRAVNDPLKRLGFTVVLKRNLELGLDVPNAAVDGYAERSIALRRGQARFKSLLLEAYAGACAVTGCMLIEILEACHVKPYSSFRDYAISNGILLRADIHTLFDIGLIKISPDDMLVHVHKSVKDEEYRKFDGRRIRQPSERHCEINKEFLMERWTRPVAE